jgi:hypothetical protein
VDVEVGIDVCEDDEQLPDLHDCGSTGRFARSRRTSAWHGWPSGHQHTRSWPRQSIEVVGPVQRPVDVDIGRLDAVSTRIRE